MKSDYWLEVSVTTDGEAAEAVSDFLLPYAYSNSVILEQRGDPDSPDPQAMEPDVTVKIFIPGTEDNESLRRKIEESLYHMQRLYLAIPAPSFKILKDEDWSTAWRKNYKPFRLGRRIWIQPSWKELVGSKANDVVILMNPGMAFGTGLHPTTQMCLQAIEDTITPGVSMLDVGTGSGILSIAAAKLGAVEIQAFDTDRMAVEATISNAKMNQVDHLIRVNQGSLPQARSKKWDLITVNILAPVIISLLNDDSLIDYLSPTGYLILSGIIEDQFSDVQTALTGAGGRVKRKMVIRDWICLIAEK